VLREPLSSEYPYSAYVIGLRKEWLFDQPFDTRPVDVSGVKTSDIAEVDEAYGGAQTDEAGM